MKIIAISDTHGRKDWVGHIDECDLLIHCGDISKMGNHAVSGQKEFFEHSFVKTLEGLLVKAKNIVFVAGNHDFYLYDVYNRECENEVRNLLPPNVHYLRDNAVEINGLKIYGSPWVINLRNWAFNFSDRDDGLAQNKYKDIPFGLDILVSHAPAHGFSDTIMEYGKTEHLGSKSLLEQIILKTPRVVLSGHIHSAQHAKQTLAGKTDFYCTSWLDESYKPCYPPLTLEM